jgi:hypothetical protein
MLLENLGKTILDRTLVIVLAHPNDENKTNILNDCLSGISFPKLLSCNYTLKEETQNMCDWIVYSKENPILMGEDFGKYDMFLSRWYIDEKGEKVHLPHQFDNQYAVCFLIKNALEYAKYLKKDFIHMVNYDFNITDEVLIENTIHLIDNDLVVYRTPPHAFGRPACSSAFFSGKISTIQTFFDQFYNADGYYWYKHDGLFLEEKIYSFMSRTVSKLKEIDLDDLGGKCKVARHAIIADFVYD